MRSNYSIRTLEILRDFFFGDVTWEVFARWLYAEPSLQEELGEDIYVELLNLNLANPEDQYRAKKLAINAYDKSGANIYKDYARSLVAGSEEGRIDIEVAVRKLANIDSEKCPELPGVFLAYCGEIDRLGSAVALPAYRARLIEEMRKLAQSLSSGCSN